MTIKKSKIKQSGAALIYLIVFIAVFTIIMLPVIDNFAAKINLLRLTIVREQAFQIAEAGTNYYQWHLIKFSGDYQDGTGGAGPYVHNYVDFDTQKTIGQFSLTITPPVLGSTIVKIQSTGWTNDNPGIKRTVTATYGIPSLAQYSLLANDGIAVYYTDEVFSGKIHSNNGIRFDATGNSSIQSAKATYTCMSWQGDGCPTVKNGVWGSASPAVQALWQFPAPAVDFSALTSNLASMKGAAQSGGIYLPPSNKQGYSLVFNNNGTVSVYVVKKTHSDPNADDGYYVSRSEDTDYNQIIAPSLPIQSTYTIPSNGIIYVEDNVWVEGTVRGRVTIAAAILPQPAHPPIIFIPDNIVYKTKDGSDVLGLLAQGDIVLSKRAPNNLEIDAAMISQTGLIEVFNTGDIKGNLTIYGSVMTFGYWFDNFVWTNGYTNNVTSGYGTTTDNYDANLLYAPPPYFPFSSSGYQLLKWTSN
jgi:hypothetical protein